MRVRVKLYTYLITSDSVWLVLQLFFHSYFSRISHMKKMNENGPEMT